MWIEVNANSDKKALKLLIDSGYKVVIMDGMYSVNEEQLKMLDAGKVEYSVARKEDEPSS